MPTFKQMLKGYAKTALRFSMLPSLVSAVQASAGTNHDCSPPEVGFYVKPESPCETLEFLNSNQTGLDIDCGREETGAMAVFYNIPQGPEQARHQQTLTSQEHCWAFATGTVGEHQNLSRLNKGTHAKNCAALTGSILNGGGGKGAHAARKETPGNPCTAEERKIAIYISTYKLSRFTQDEIDLSQAEKTKLEGAGAIHYTPKGSYIIEHKKIPSKALRKKLGMTVHQHEHYIVEGENGWFHKNGANPAMPVMPQKTLNYLEQQCEKLSPLQREKKLKALSFEAAQEPPKSITPAYWFNSAPHSTRSPGYELCPQRICFDTKAVQKRQRKEVKARQLKESKKKHNKNRYKRNGL